MFLTSVYLKLVFWTLRILVSRPSHFPQIEKKKNMAEKRNKMATTAITLWEEDAIQRREFIKRR